MKRIDRIVKNRFSLCDAMRARINSHLDDIFLEDEGMLGELDRWTQRHITEENISKLSLVLNSNDPAEACYKDLIREIDTEAETGIYMVRPESPAAHLSRLMDEAGVSGELGADIQAIAPDVLRHRIILNYEAAADGITTDRFVSELIARIAVP